MRVDSYRIEFGEIFRSHVSAVREFVQAYYRKTTTNLNNNYKKTMDTVWSWENMTFDFPSPVGEGPVS